MEDFIFGLAPTSDIQAKNLKQRLAGVSHNHARRPLDPQPGQPVEIRLSVGPDFPFEKAWVYWTNDRSDPSGAFGQAGNGHAAPLESAGSEWQSLLWGYVRHFKGTLPPAKAGEVIRYRLSASDGQKEVFADDGAYYAYYIDYDPPPAWTRSAVVYQIFADRFYSTAPDFPRVEGRPSYKCNGTLNGITAKLDSLAELGVNCLWLTPIFPSPSYHGYDATSFFEVAPRLGTKEDFRKLIDEAHARGMRILMDFVPNHWSNQHPSFIEARKDQNSQYVKWYTFNKWPNDYRCFFSVRELPQINLRHAPAREHVLEAARYWLEFGVDGYRVDYCIGPSPDFYAEFRRVTRETKPDCWTFGEAVDPPDSQLRFHGGMDGALDFMLLEAFRAAFAQQKWNAKHLGDFLDRHEAYFPADFSRPSFLDNHDMNRFLFMAGGDKRKLRLAALCQFTLQGPPVIYYGTEVGESQNIDIRQANTTRHEECRLPMLWGAQQDIDLLNYYKGVVHLRIATPVLCEGDRKKIYSDDALLAYRRSYQGKSVAVVLNLSARPVGITLPLQESRILYGTGLDCSASGGSGEVRLDLPAYGGVILE